MFRRNLISVLSSVILSIISMFGVLTSGHNNNNTQQTKSTKVEPVIVEATEYTTIPKTTKTTTMTTMTTTNTTTKSTTTTTTITTITTTEVVTETACTNSITSLNYVTEAERVMLCNVVAGEYGADWVPLYDKACVVACVMNRYYDGGWTAGMENTIYNVIVAPYQFNPIYANTAYNWNVTQSCIDAVEYYFQYQEEFPHYLSFYGDGTYNYFS